MKFHGIKIIIESVKKKMKQNKTKQKRMVFL